MKVGPRLAAAGAAALAACGIWDVPAIVAAERFVPGQALVQFAPGTPTARIELILQGLGLRIKTRLGDPETMLVEFAPEVPVEEMIERLKAFREVLVAEPNRLLLAAPGGQGPAFAPGGASGGTVRP